MIAGPFIDGFKTDYDVEDLRELTDDSEEDGPDPNYRCKFCKQKRHINDYQKYTPAWCDRCGSVKGHERLE